ncbi:hypothetical protein JFY74_21085 [Pectobacterium carotovorum]|nr:hypothetical protein JFY74_21085 [Pectobacterium carotovorum]
MLLNNLEQISACQSKNHSLSSKLNISRVSNSGKISDKIDDGFAKHNELINDPEHIYALKESIVKLSDYVINYKEKEEQTEKELIVKNTRTIVTHLSCFFLLKNNEELALGTNRFLEKNIIDNHTLRYFGNAYKHEGEALQKLKEHVTDVKQWPTSDLQSDVQSDLQTEIQRVLKERCRQDTVNNSV